ncbi:unnamed protein product [Symbiodinium necroappetens]|uniref:ZZ-type domain-containing protein n=1 Tax=Symbiodinium necroappetens TaxID=1628268 RepID=A0A812NJ71_9DINO|nr:unnamed protein product [Symbiodinium necroappetens]
MPLGVEALEAAVDAALAAEDGRKSVHCLSPVVEALRTQTALAQSFLPGVSDNGSSRDYLRVTCAFERLVTKGSSPWFAQLADLLRGAAAEVMPILPRRPFAQSDFSESDARNEEADMDVHESGDPDKASSSGTGSTEEPKEDAAEMLDVEDMDVDDELSTPSITWLSALLSAILPLLTNALPRDQNEVAIIPHPHKMERQEAAEDTMNVHLGTSRWRPVFNTKKICDNCGTRITDRFYYHCSENCDIDFCQDCHTRSRELLDAFMAEVDEVNDENLSRRLFWVIDITERIGWHVLHLNTADRRRLAHELAFSWPTVLFEKLAQAAVDVVNARVVHVQDVKDIQSDERFWHAVGWLQFLYSTNELPCKTRRLEEQSSRGPKVDYELFVLDGINKCEPLSEFQRWRKHPGATVPKVLDVRRFKITNDFCSFLTHSNLVPVNFRRVCLLCDVWEQMQALVTKQPWTNHARFRLLPQRLVHAVIERFCESLKDADLRQPWRQSTPSHQTYERDTMLLTPGDRLLLEQEEHGWNVRVEYLSPDAPTAIGHLRQRRCSLIAAERRAQPQATTRGTTPLVTIPEHGDTDNAQTQQHEPTDSRGASSSKYQEQATASASSSSSHEPPPSYCPQTRSKTSAARDQPREHVNTLSDGRSLRKSQKESQIPTQAAAAAAKPKAATPLAELLSDGRELRRGRHNQAPQGSNGGGPTTPTTTSIDTTPSFTTTTTSTTQPDGDDNSLMQSSQKRAPNKQQSGDIDITATSPTQNQTPTSPYPTPPEEGQVASDPDTATAVNPAAEASTPAMLEHDPGKGSNRGSWKFGASQKHTTTPKAEQ